MKCLVVQKWLLPMVKVPARNFCSIVAKNVKVGDCVAVERSCTLEEVQAFAKVTRDWNPIHRTKEGDDSPVIVHGAYLSGLVSAVMGTELPGPGSILAEQLLKFPSPCYAGETVLVEVEVVSARKIVECEFRCCVGEKVVLRGSAKLIVNKKVQPVV